MCVEVRERKDSASWCAELIREVRPAVVCMGGIVVKLISLDLIEKQFMWM